MKEQWSALFLIIPQFIGSIVNGINSIDKGYGHSYPVWTYVLIGLWLLVVMSADIFTLLFKISPFRTALQKCWGISSAIAIVLVFCLLNWALCKHFQKQC